MFAFYNEKSFRHREKNFFIEINFFVRRAMERMGEKLYENIMKTEARINEILESLIPSEW
jgi:hypothetical protein